MLKWRDPKPHALHCVLLKTASFNYTYFGIYLRIATLLLTSFRKRLTSPNSQKIFRYPSVFHLFLGYIA